ncbi:MAG: hypothetical protein ACK41Q_09305 [Candidatus Brocadia sp.]
MKKVTKKVLSFIFTLGITVLTFCTILQTVMSGAETVKEDTYQEVEKDGRLYVFTSPMRLTDFEKSGELGKAVIKIGYGPNGETVVFDSDEAVGEYDKRHSQK